MEPALTIATAEESIESAAVVLDIESPARVFAVVFEQLPDVADVYPTENYYYFSFYAAARWYWGNLRLGVEERDRGELSFVYWEYLDDPRSPDDSRTWQVILDRSDGVIIERVSPLRYMVSFRGKRVLFRLHELSQAKPDWLGLRRGEEFLARTFDESGFGFLLLFDRISSQFLWVLDAAHSAALPLVSVADKVWLDRLSGFAFFDDAERNRKALIGVRALNVRRNNYWDGPFDQLADNYPNPRLAGAIERAYPCSRGRIDAYGKFKDTPGSRVAISPYIEYEVVEELLDVLEGCGSDASAEFLACLTHDAGACAANP